MRRGKVQRGKDKIVTIFLKNVNSQSKCNSSKEAALSAKNSSINFKKKAKNNKKGD